jgi:hypothetical protein
VSEEFNCPVCGTEVSVKAKACPECGSDEKTGWSANAVYDGTGIEDPDDFDYEEWKRTEHGSLRPQIGWWWWGVAVVMLGVLIWLIIR